MAPRLGRQFCRGLTATAAIPLTAAVIAAAEGIASLVSEEELSREYIIPKAFDPRVGKTVAKAVYDCAVATGVARINK